MYPHKVPNNALLPSIMINLRLFSSAFFTTEFNVTATIYFINVGIVRQGQTYGPTDHICDEIVSFVRKCGHATNLKCGEAFQQALSSVKCTENETVINPECGHKVIIKCHEKQDLQAKGLLQYRDAVECLHEGRSRFIFGRPIFHAKCSEQVLLIRNCKHRQTVKCYEARDEHIQPCSETVIAKNPLCMHDVKIPCSLSDFCGWKPWNENPMPLVGGVLYDNHSPPGSPPDNLNKYVLNCKENVEVVKTGCRHKYKTKYGLGMKEMGTKNKLKCTEEIENAKLRCGHSRKYKCWEYSEYKANPEKTICKEEISLTCWNYALCGSVLKSRCNLTGQIMKCQKKLKYVCHMNHVTKEFPLCRQGIPSHCPDCILADIRSHRETVKYSKSMKETIFLPNIPGELMQFHPKKIYSQKSINNFLDSQMLVLANLENWSKQEAPLKRPVFAHSMVPCFIYDFGGQIGSDFKQYMMASTLSGTQVCEWTINNIKLLIEEAHRRQSNDVCLLFGYVFCCRVLVDPSDYPGKKKKRLQKKDWVSEKRHMEAYFTIQHNRNQWDNLVVWDPYPILATHKIWLTVPNLQQISSQLNQSSTAAIRADLQPQLIQFQIPENAKSLVVTAYSEEEDEDFEDVSSEFGFSRELGKGRAVNWDGLTLGRKEIFDDHIQKELMDKLQFCVNASG